MGRNRRELRESHRDLRGGRKRTTRMHQRTQRRNSLIQRRRNRCRCMRSMITTWTEAVGVDNWRDRHTLEPPMTMKWINSVPCRPRSRRWKAKPPPIAKGRPPITRMRPPITMLEDELIAFRIRTETASQTRGSRDRRVTFPPTRSGRRADPP